MTVTVAHKIAAVAAAGTVAGIVGLASPAQAAPAPHYTWGNITGTVYFNVEETNELAYTASLVGVEAIAEAPFGLIITEKSLDILAKAAIARNTGRCLKIKSTGSIGIYGGSDGDGYCR
jgi:hypothetical protein